jgi:hypothetical protein
MRTPGSGEAVVPTQPAGVAGEPAEGAIPAAAARIAALRSRMPPADAAGGGDAIGTDAIAELAFLTGGEGAGRAPRNSSGLAAALLDHVAPTATSLGRLTPGRVVSLLELAAGTLEAAPEEDILAALGAEALRHELDRHRELAERRGTMVEG